MSKLHNDTIKQRVERIKADLVGRDFEGVTTVCTADLIKITEYLDNVLEFVRIINSEEESDSGRVFKPNKLRIDTCRVMTGQRLSEIIPKMGIE